MAFTPSRKSIFAPSTPNHTGFLSPISQIKTNFSSDDNNLGSSNFLCVKSNSLSPSSFEDTLQKVETLTPGPRSSLLKRAQTKAEHSKLSPISVMSKDRLQIRQMNTAYAPNKFLKKSQTTFAKSKTLAQKKNSPTSAVETEPRTPKMFKEYKYRSTLKDGIKSINPEKEIDSLGRLSIFSAHGSRIIDTRPVEAPRIRKLKTQNSGSATSKNLFGSSLLKTPSYLKGGNSIRNFSTSNISDSSEEEEEESFSEQRMRLKRILKKGLYTTYFLGVMLTLKSKVKVFGAVRRIEYLEEFESSKPPDGSKDLFPILPSSIFGVVWGLIMVFLLVVTAILTPIYISFIDDDNMPFYYLNLVTDILFAIDIGINFLTAYYDGNSGQLITSFKKIAMNYLRMWFWIDVISIFPLNDIIEIATEKANSLSRAGKIMKLLRFPRLYKLIKIVRLLKLAKFLSANSSFNHLQKKLNLNARFFKLVKIFINFAFLNHLVGCLWFFIARFEDFSPDTWVQRVDLADKDVTTQYIASIYWSFQTLTTVGYGDIAPQTALERSIASIWTVIGVLIYSFTVGNLSTMFFSFGVQTESLKNKLISFDHFSKQANLPDFLNQKVRRFFEVNHKEHAYHFVDPNETFKSLSANLKTNILLFSYYDMIRKISFLQVNPNFTSSLLVHLKFLSFTRGEVIYREDDPAYEIYFILRGRVKFVTREAKEIYSLSEGTYFGEVEVFDKEKRKYFCKAQDPT